MAVDEVGDPAGAPVLYLHGTPDSRLARHPDDGLAAAAGVRLLAIDRPGYGGSSPLPHRRPGRRSGRPR
jgi:pimeloyl-ACP methyl ester carboxylesterase